MNSQSCLAQVNWLTQVKLGASIVRSMVEGKIAFTSDQNKLNHSCFLAINSYRSSIFSKWFQNLLFNSATLCVTMTYKKLFGCPPLQAFFFLIRGNVFTVLKTIIPNIKISFSFQNFQVYTFPEFCCHHFRLHLYLNLQLEEIGSIDLALPLRGS